MKPLRLACLALLAAAPEPAPAQTPAPGPPSMSTVVSRSAARSAETQPLRAAQRGVPLASGCPYTVTQHVIPANDDGSGFFTGTGFPEIVQVMTPCGFDPNGPDLPLIMVHNGWGLSAASFFNGMSDIPNEANARGWLLAVFTQLDDKSFGVVPFPQTNVEKALDFVIANYPVDQDRIYGVGWSAGGGSIVSYAVRHLDPARPMLAAVVTNAGSYDLIHTYNNEVPSVQTLMENPVLLKGPPSGTTLWQYYLSHSEEIQGGPFLVPERTKLRNLKHIPVYHTWSTDDSIVYLRDQNQAFSGFVQSLDPGNVSIAFTGLPVPHSWDLIDAKAALDFLAQHTVVREPAEFDVLCDKDLAYYWTEVDLRAQKVLSPLFCRADAAENRLEVEAANMARIDVKAPLALFDPNASFALEFTTTDQAETVFVFHGVESPPTYVLVDLLLDATWVHDPAQKTLSLTAPGGGTTSVLVRYDEQTGVLAAPAVVNPPQNVPLSLQAQTPSAPAFLLLGLNPGAVPMSLFDPADDRLVLVGLDATTVLVPFALDGAGSMNFVLGSDASMVGITLFMQFLTYPGAATLVDEMSNRAEVRFE